VTNRHAEPHIAGERALKRRQSPLDAMTVKEMPAIGRSSSSSLRSLLCPLSAIETRA
jgi:hypothetical protein